MKQPLSLSIFSNPSYYYQHKPKQQYESHEREKFYKHRPSYSSSNSSSDPADSSREEWEIVNQAFVQSNKNNHIPTRPNLQYQHSQSSSLSSGQQKDCIMLNPDRSLKMDKSHKKSPQLQLKNKSLSSPTNKTSFQSIFKKQPNKIVGTDKLNSKPKSEKIRKQKVQKQKKISNGSLSTNHTKAKPKKPKISKKMIQLQKSSISQQSNEFLVLGEELYDYQDMSKIQTRGFLPSKSNTHERDTNKKVTFSYYENENVSQQQINPVLSHLSSFIMYDETKLSKKLQKTISKIQKYMLGFLEAQGFQEAKQEALENTQSLSLQAKIQLYNSLMNDTQLLKELQNQTKEKQIEKIDDVIKLSIDKVEKKSEKLIKQYQHEQSLISKWKNSKLHQLSTARKILEKLLEDQSNQFEKNNWQNSESGSSLRSEIDALDEQNDPILALQKQLESVMNEEYYPQMKKQTINLRRVLNDLLKNEHFPQPKQETQSEVTERGKMEDTKNYFTPNGVLWFFQKFFSFIMEKPNYIEELVQKLNEGYGFDFETKKKISRTSELQKWYEFLGDQEQVNHKALIETDVFREFQETVIRTDPQIGEEMFVWMHHFNRAIIDCFNDQFHRFRPFYPNGEPVPYLQKAGKYFEITPESIYYFFEKCKFQVYTNYITFFAGLILPEGHEENKETRKYNLAKEIKALNQDILYDWESYHSLQTVARMSTFEAIYQTIEEEIYSEFTYEFTLKIINSKY